MNRVVAYAVVLVLVSFSAPSSAIGQATAPAVSAQDDLFSPVMIHLNPGDSLSWHNDGTEQHTITADDDSFDSGVLDPGQTFERTFASPGSYPYYCTIHGGPNADGMAGVIVVS
ncbi:MAG: cupredoxin domain-containing protein [Chloroflexota bacterium]